MMAKMKTAQMANVNVLIPIVLVSSLIVLLGCKPSKQVINHAKSDQHQDEVMVTVDEMPEYPGGIVALTNFMAQRVKYPVEAQRKGIQGKVYVNFIVEKDGSVGAVSIARGVYPDLDAEALRVVNLLPKWKPGKQKGKLVRVLYTVPINFALR